MDIDDRNEDLQFIRKETFRAELGIRSIGIMYHDHSNDVKSYENVFRLKDNIEYRLMSATHQYFIFLKELHSSESYLENVLKENRNALQEVVPGRNPHLVRVETELSSVFDTIVFHLSSVFDYLSHSICYMYFTNKEKTDYWMKLVRKTRGDLKGEFEFCNVMDEIDKRFVGPLYDYRSRLLHNKRDRHELDGLVTKDLKVRLQVLCSEASIKRFTLAKERVNGKTDVTLTYLASWLIKQTFVEIENLLDAIKSDIQKNSHFHQNMMNPKPHGVNPGFNMVLAVPGTPFIQPVSDSLWEEYKLKKKGKQE